MNDQSPVAGRLNKSPVVGSLNKSPVVGRLNKAQFHHVESKEKKSVKECMAQARAQRKASELIALNELKKLSWNCTVEEFKKMLWKDIVVDPEMLADARRRNLKEDEDLKKMILEEESRILHREYPTDFSYLFEFDWKKARMDLGELDWDDIVEADGFWDDDDLEEPVLPSCDKTVLKEPVLPSCDKTDLEEPVLPSCDKTVLKEPVLPSCDKTDLEEPVLDRIDSDLENMRLSLRETLKVD